MTRALGVLRSIARNRAGRRDSPRFLTYIVTFSCNARCIMCDSWRKPSPDDLSLDEIDRIFAQLPRLDAVRLSGGEPFARKDLPEIARLAQQHLRPAMLHVTTNGFLTDRIAVFCERRDRATPLMLLVSIDGMKDKHDRVRGRSTAWDAATRTLRELAPRQHELRLRLAVNQTIVDAEGAAQYRDLHAFLKSLGVAHNMVMAYDASATYSTADEAELAPAETGGFATFGEDFTPEALRRLLDEAEEDLRDLPVADRVAKRYYFRGIRNRLLGGKGSPNPRCVALNTHMRILPNGDVPTCQFSTKRVGSLRTQTFAEIWHGGGKSMETQRAWVSKCAGCWAECEVLPNAAYTGDILRGALGW